MNAARLVLIPLLVLATGCGLTTPERRYVVPAVDVEDRQSIPYGSVEVRDITLPTYAAFEEIALEAPEGGLELSSSMLWADDPARAVTLALTRNLAEITGARIASEPWPFENFPDARVEVRVEDMLATGAGVFRLAGQYFVGPLDTVGRDKARRFEITVPIEGEQSPQAIGAARSRAVADLARQIVRDGLR